MAILSKIRDRSGFLILVIGLAMFSFVVSPKDIIDFFSNKNKDIVGEVNGKEITYKEFATRVENVKAQSRNNAYGALAIENMVWEQLVREKIYESKLEEAGVIVGEKEIWQAILTSPQVINSPQFKDAQGKFNEDLLKDYIANLELDNSSDGKARLQGWLSYEQAVKQNLLTQTYNELINAGVVVSEQEVTKDYILNNTKVTADYVYLPFASIPNSEVKVSQDEVADYVKEYQNNYQTEATRDVKVVKFSFQASNADEQEIKQQLAALIEDSKAYNKITKATELVKGFKQVKDAYLFANEVGSDLPINNSFQTQKEIPTVIKDKVVNGEVGTVVGPYKFSKYYKLTKIVATQKLPDSVKASHILINYVGAQSAQQNTTRTLADAQKLADSILKIVQKSPRKFSELAKNYSVDPGSASKGGALGWFGYRTMVPEFRDFCFENKKGKVGIVRTNFGLHVLRIEDQKDFNQAYKLATISRKIEASEETENKVFEKAELFANSVRNGGDFEALAKENGYTVSPVSGLKELDVYVGSVGENRRIVKWAFAKETNTKDTKRFDLDEKGYAVVMLANKQEKGTKSAASVFSQVEPILRKQKKAKILKEKMEAASLDAIAKKNQLQIETFTEVSLEAPTIPGVGIEPSVVSAAAATTKETLLAGVVGDKGVFALVTKQVKEPTKDAIKENSEIATTQLKSLVSGQLYAALKENATIKDYRAQRY